MHVRGLAYMDQLTLIDRYPCRHNDVLIVHNFADDSADTYGLPWVAYKTVKNASNRGFNRVQREPRLRGLDCFVGHADFRFSFGDRLGPWRRHEEIELSLRSLLLQPRLFKRGVRIINLRFRHLLSIT